MARRYLLLLFSFTFLLAGGLLFWLGARENAVERERTEMAAAYVEDLERSVAVHREELNDLCRTTLHQLEEEPYSTMYRTVIPLLHQLRLNTDLSAPNAHPESLAYPAGETNQRIEWMITMIKDTVSNNHEWLEFSAQDAVSFGQNLDKIHQQHISLTKTLRGKTDAISAKRRELYYLLTLQEITRKTAAITGHKALICGFVFPVINSSGSNFAKNAAGTFEVGIGSYSGAYDPDHVILVVGNDTLDVQPNGHAVMKVPTSVAGEHTLTTKCIITNPLTGLVQVGEGSYTYFVRE